MEIMPTTQQLTKAQLKLPDDLQQMAVLLEFVEPVQKALLSDFRRIGLTPQMLAGGEEQFHLAHRWQPHHAQPHCGVCRLPMRPIGGARWQCRNPACRLIDETPTNQVNQLAGPRRGVVKLAYAPEFTHRIETVTDKLGRTHQVEWVTAVVLVLDRRYRPEVIAAVNRTAREIAEEFGWKLK